MECRVLGKCHITESGDTLGSLWLWFRGYGNYKGKVTFIFVEASCLNSASNGDKDTGTAGTVSCQIMVGAVSKYSLLSLLLPQQIHSLAFWYQFKKQVYVFVIYVFTCSWPFNSTGSELHGPFVCGCFREWLLQYCSPSWLAEGRPNHRCLCPRTAQGQLPKVIDRLSTARKLGTPNPWVVLGSPAHLEMLEEPMLFLLECCVRL